MLWSLPLALLCEALEAPAASAWGAGCSCPAAGICNPEKPPSALLSLPLGSFLVKQLFVHHSFVGTGICGNTMFLVSSLFAPELPCRKH